MHTFPIQHIQHDEVSNEAIDATSGGGNDCSNGGAINLSASSRPSSAPTNNGGMEVDHIDEQVGNQE